MLSHLLPFLFEKLQSLSLHGELGSLRQMYVFALLTLKQLQTWTVQASQIHIAVLPIALVVVFEAGCYPVQMPVPAVQARHAVVKITQRGVSDLDMPYFTDAPLVFADPTSLPMAFKVAILSCEGCGHLAGTVDSVFIDQDTLIVDCHSAEGLSCLNVDVVCEMTLTHKENNLSLETSKLQKTCLYVSRCKVLDVTD